MDTALHRCCTTKVQSSADITCYKSSRHLLERLQSAAGQPKMSRYSLSGHLPAQLYVSGKYWATYLHSGAYCCSQSHVVVVDQKALCAEQECKYGAVCKVSIDGLSARCICPGPCYDYGDSEGSELVCGTDGKDYASQCELARDSCKAMEDVQVAHPGKCGM